MYPDAEDFDFFENSNGKKVIKCRGSLGCIICGESSCFTDYRLRVCICSEECQEILWKDRDEKGNTKK